MSNYKETLRNHVCKVEFEKLDRSIRTMICTLRADKVAEMPPSATGCARTPNPNQISVVDVEKGEWRSFRIDSVISFEIVE
jgi:hypothetical protein